MYNFLRTLGLKKFLTAEMPSLGASLIIAETAYKFGSFTLECGAFLTTWYAISFIVSKVSSSNKD